MSEVLLHTSSYFLFSTALGPILQMQRLSYREILVPGAFLPAHLDPKAFAS